MSAHKAKAARKPPVAASRRRVAAHRTPPWWRSWKGAAVAIVALSLVAASAVVPSMFDRRQPTAHTHATAASAIGDGSGLPVGASVPAFRERDVVSGSPITNTSIAGTKTLLFFSEGVMCQACFEQISGLEAIGGQLARRGIKLVSITPDSPAELRQAIDQYGIKTPMISDGDRSMSEAFNTLGRGMHADTPGHAFALVAGGKVLWYRDYWLPPADSMYVDPATRLADIPN